MESVADLVEPERLRLLASAANLRTGTELADEGKVTLEEFGPLAVRGVVGGGRTAARRVELRSTGEELLWRCTCTRKPALFCKHLVACAIVTWRKAPPRAH